MAEIALLDGGVGQEINNRSAAETHPLWSVKVMFETPAIVSDVHRAFIQAGARVICLNTYAATPSRLSRYGYGDRLKEAHRTAADLAIRAIEEAHLPRSAVQVAGCVPPLVASYRPDVSKDYAASLAEYRQVVAGQKDLVDLFLIETMASIEEAKAALDATGEQDKPAYLGLTLSDNTSNTLRSGEPLAQALEALLPKHPAGILLNCSIPEAISNAMPLLAGQGVPFGGYANRFASVVELPPGGTVDALVARPDITPGAYATHVEQWIDQGATIVGGCCEIGPDYIRHLAERLTTAGHTLVPLS